LLPRVRLWHKVDVLIAFFGVAFGLPQSTPAVQRTET